MSTEPSVILAVFKMLGALASVLVCLWILYALMKRFGARNRAASGQSLIRVLETKSMGLKRQLAILEVMGDFFLIGISGEGFTVLSRIRTGKRPGCTEGSSGNPPINGFGAYLGGVLGTPAEKGKG